MMKTEPQRCVCSGPVCAKLVPIFTSLSEEDLVLVTSLVKKEFYKKGQALINEGQISNALFIIHYGKVKLSKTTIEGKEQILHLLMHGDFFGELSVFQQNQVSNFTAYALEDTEVCILNRNDLALLMKKHSDISVKIVQEMTNRLSHTENLLQTLATNDAETRLAHLLTYFCEKYGKKTPEGIEILLPITREEMANYIGVTRETISRKLSKFEAEGTVQVDGKRLIVKELSKLYLIN